MSGRDRGERLFSARRLVTSLVWVVLLLGLWLWGRRITDVPSLGMPTPATGDMAAVGRPDEVRLPPAHRPLADAGPRRVEIAALGVRAPVVVRGLDGTGAIDPPPFEQAGSVGWFGRGTAPGARGAALFVGHVDTEERPAVFHRLSELRPGEKVRVARDDGTLAEFTVDDVRVVPRTRFDAHQVYGAHRPDRAELRLITCGGTFDSTTGGYSANVVVSAYLTGSDQGLNR